MGLQIADAINVCLLLVRRLACSRRSQYPSVTTPRCLATKRSALVLTGEDVTSQAVRDYSAQDTTLPKLLEAPHALMHGANLPVMNKRARATDAA